MDDDSDVSTTAAQQRRARTLRRNSHLLLALLLVVGAGLVVAGLREPGVSASAFGPPGPPGPYGPRPGGPLPTPYDEAIATLRAQSAALLRGDESAFLAAADSGLQARYRDMFHNLRALGVTRFDYFPDGGQRVADDPDGLSVRVDIRYCFGAHMCPAQPQDIWGSPPRIAQTLTFRRVAGRYVIAEVVTGPRPDARQPTPWENGRLAVAQGRRVTVLASPTQARHLAEVLSVAEAAAQVDDRFAAVYGTPQVHYRVYLAGDSQWKSWYRGEKDRWAIGVTVPLNRYGLDVMLRVSQVGDPQILRLTLQHEFGHVVTLDGSAVRAASAADAWVVEGIAEYVGWWPRRAGQSFRAPSVRAAVAAGAPRTIVLELPAANASQGAGDAFYGLSHFAMECMSRRYGEPKLFAFVKAVLTDGASDDVAARSAYGVPFASVDTACVSWIRQQV